MAVTAEATFRFLFLLWLLEMGAGPRLPAADLGSKGVEAGGTDPLAPSPSFGLPAVGVAPPALALCFRCFWVVKQVASEATAGTSCCCSGGSPLAVAERGWGVLFRDLPAFLKDSAGVMAGDATAAG